MSVSVRSALAPPANSQVTGPMTMFLALRNPRNWLTRYALTGLNRPATADFSSARVPRYRALTPFAEEKLQHLHGFDLPITAAPDLLGLGERHVWLPGRG